MRYSLFVILFIFSLSYILISCDYITGSTSSSAIDFENPRIGQNSRYVNFLYVNGIPPENTPIYELQNDTLEFQISTVSLGIIKITVNSTLGYDYCSILYNVNEKKNIISNINDTCVKIDFGPNESPSDSLLNFIDYMPEISSRGEVFKGYTINYQINGKVYDKVYATCDPSGIPVDVGGICKIFDSDGGLLRILNYAVFGIDGGWDLIIHEEENN